MTTKCQMPEIAENYLGEPDLLDVIEQVFPMTEKAYLLNRDENLGLFVERCLLFPLALLDGGRN
jgi:hypothetical protein